MTKTFLVTQAPADAGMGDGAWLGFLGGVLTAAAAWAGPGEAGIVTITGIMGATSGLLGAGQSAEVSDPHFTSFADLSDKFSDMITEADKVVEHYYNSLFATLPKNGDEAAGIALAEVLKSGAFSEESIALEPQDGSAAELLLRIVRAPIISEIFNNQRLFIAKIPRGKIYLEGSPPYIFDPCFGGDKHEDILKDRIYCPAGSVDKGYYNYLVVSSLLLSQSCVS